MNPAALEKLIEQGHDTPEARLAAGSARLKYGDLAQAIGHLEQAVKLKPDYSMAWQLLGTARQQAGDRSAAASAWKAGLAAARGNGDKQTEKVIGVFLRRLERD